MADLRMRQTEIHTIKGSLNKIVPPIILSMLSLAKSLFLF